MKKAQIVIGLGFGDEGKGFTTDFLVNKYPDSIVVRFSGGQQAGHNVVIDDISHVHSNFGSGALRGVPSYFSEHTTFYPLTLYRERLVLQEKLPNINPINFYHPLSMMTTPADVIYNRIRETEKNHGSCGLGIGTTMSRNIETGYKLHAIDLSNEAIFRQKMSNIRSYYLNKITDENLKDVFQEEVSVEEKKFNEALKILTEFKIKPYSFLNQFNNIIFEGSQGILLDMDHGIFPNVTYANTTSKNAIEILNKLHRDIVEIYYVTRCYQTRHGNGWMSNSEPIELVNNEDETNIFNRWQKNFRVSELDYNLLNHAIEIDSIYSGQPYKNLVITCLDQRPDFVFDKTRLNYQFYNILYSYSPDSKYLMDNVLSHD